jgi:tetratricopeptide (TPR) repeat protein
MNEEFRISNEEFRIRNSSFEILHSSFGKIISMRCLIALSLLFAACATPRPPTQPNESEWSRLSTEYALIDTQRNAQLVPPPSAPRKQIIEAMLENHRKLEPAYLPFMETLKEYYDRTADPRAASILMREKIILGDEYLSVLSRYDKALEFYRAAAQLDPNSVDAKQRIEFAESRRYVAMNNFAAVKVGMKEDEVRALVGLPREDWIKQVVQNSRVYSVWIYPKADGGASAIYFDNGVVYHTNWNAAAPAAAQK